MGKVLREYPVLEVFYRRAGKKLSRLFLSKIDEHKFRSKLKKNRRKYLGTRNVTLVELTQE